MESEVDYSVANACQWSHSRACHQVYVTHCSFKIRFNIILKSTPRLDKLSLPFRLTASRELNETQPEKMLLMVGKVSSEYDE
jgi:hypothetical protein